MTESRHQLAAQSVRDQQVFATHQQAASYQAPLHQEASSYQVATSYQQASNVHQAAQAPQHLEVRMEQAQRLIEKMNAIMATFDAPAAAINHSVSQVAQNEVIHQGVHEVYSVPMTHISQAASIDYDRAVAIENVYNAPVAHSEVTHATSAQQAANGWQPAEDANQQVRMTANMAAVAGATRLASATGNAPPVVPAASTVAPRPARVSRLTLAMGRATTKQASPPPLSTSVEGPVKV